jgi:hypothetical protein
MAYDIVCPHCGKRDYYHELWCKVWDNHHTRKEKPENEEVDMTDIDTSSEAVERTAKSLSERRGGPLNSPFDPLSIEAAALLRQLVKERHEARYTALDEALECFDFNIRQPRSEIHAAIVALKDKP